MDVTTGSNIMDILCIVYHGVSHSRIAEYIRVYENRDKIAELCDASHKPIGIFKALRVLKQHRSCVFCV